MICISINYKKTEVDERQKISFSAEEKKEFWKLLKKRSDKTECVILSTCNRTEIYFEDSGFGQMEMERLICECKGILQEKLVGWERIYQGRKAVLHLHKVAAGLDSMILGEDEILGQLRDAYMEASGAGMAGSGLHLFFQNAIGCAKKVKTDTELSRLPVSVGTLCANLVAERRARSILIIGLSGKTGNIIAKNLLAKDPSFRLSATVRGHNNPLDVAYKDIRTVEYSDRYLAAAEADVIISATTSPHYILTAGEMEQIRPQERSRLFIDLAVPADIDREIGRMPGAEIINIDFFETLAAENNKKKQEAAKNGEILLEEAVEEVMKKAVFHDFLPMLPQVEELIGRTGIGRQLYVLKEKLGEAAFENFLDGLKKLLT